MIRSPSPRPPRTTSLRDKRIGRKVLLADRLAHALDNSAQQKTRKDWRKITSRPRLAAAIVLCVVAIGALGVATTQYYSAQQAQAQKAEEAERVALRKKDAAKADACRQAKANQKADLIGKVTYDELYDGDECDK